MNATTHQEAAVLDLEPQASASRPLAVQPQGQALAINSPAGMMLAALGQGATLEHIEKMMELQERWEAGEAVKAYNAAFAAFKTESVRIVKNRKVSDGPLKGKDYAELHSVLDAVVPLLSKHGLGASWKLTRDEPQWLEVTCTLKHSGGHFEVASMGGPPDTGGAKNAIQARASTVSYLERYTFKAVTGVAEGGEDNDGNGGEPELTLAELWVSKAVYARTTEALQAIRTQGTAAFTKAKDNAGYKQFAAAVRDHGSVLTAQAKEPTHA